MLLLTSYFLKLKFLKRLIDLVTSLNITNGSRRSSGYSHNSLLWHLKEVHSLFQSQPFGKFQIVNFLILKPSTCWSFHLKFSYLIHFLFWPLFISITSSHAKRLNLKHYLSRKIFLLSEARLCTFTTTTYDYLYIHISHTIVIICLKLSIFIIKPEDFEDRNSIWFIIVSSPQFRVWYEKNVWQVCSEPVKSKEWDITVETASKFNRRFSDSH